MTYFILPALKDFKLTWHATLTS